MRKKMFCIFVITLLISSVVIITTAGIQKEENKKGVLIKSLDVPDDFGLDAYCGGFSTWTDLYRIQIDNQGNGKYLVEYAKDRDSADFTEIGQFKLNYSQISYLWDEIGSNDFFDLNNTYSESDMFPDSDILISGGTFANIIIKANGIQHMVETRHVGVPEFDNIMTTINSLTPGDYDLFYNGLYNTPPFVPSPPLGPTSGNIREEHTYTTKAIDMDKDNLYYQFDWGDGIISDWVGPFASGEVASLKHKWSSKGDYIIRAQTKDDPNSDGDLSDGIESVWSEPLAVTLPKLKINNAIILKVIQRFFNVLPIFDFFKINSPEWKLQTSEPIPPTEIKLDEEKCEIKITIRIQIWGEGASDALASQLEAGIEDKLNKDKDGKPWKLKCPKEECKKEDPGCSVKIEVVITNAGPRRPDTGQGSHVLYVGPRQSEAKLNFDGDRFVSFVFIADANKNDNLVDYPRPNDATSCLPPPPNTPIIHNGGSMGCLHADDSIGTWAHEILHLMGLDDKYDSEWVDADEDTVRDANEVKVKPKPGHEDDIMANVTKWLQQWAINKTMERAGIKCPCKCCPIGEDSDPPNTKINTPANGEAVESVCIVKGYADDGEDGSGVALLDFDLEWNGGNYNGQDYPVVPPKTYVEFQLGPLNLENYIEPGDWIKITVYATDAAGNIGEDSVTVTLEQGDTTPPATVKIIGQPNEQGGYIIWPFTPISFTATDDESGIKYIYYEVWWDSNGDELVDKLMGSEKVYDESLTFSVNMWGVLIGFIELRWYAVDNAENFENMHYQKHFVNP